MDLSPRAVIAGRYRVDTKVGAGGMGEVWLGEHIAVGTRVAVKTLLPAAAMNYEVVARFKREAFILGKIRSDNVARVVDFVAAHITSACLLAAPSVAHEASRCPRKSMVCTIGNVA